MAQQSRLTAPNAAAYADGNTEAMFARAIAQGGEDAAYMVPYFLSAGMRQRANADQYSLQLANTNALAMQEGAAERAAEDVRNRRGLVEVLLKNPGAANAYTLSAAEVRDPALQAGLERDYRLNTQSETTRNLASAASSAAEAGLRMPMGATLDPATGFSAPMQQGLPTSTINAGIAAASSARTGRSEDARLAFLTEQERLRGEREERRLNMQHSNNMELEEYRLTGRVRARSEVTPVQEEQVLSAARRAATAQFSPPGQYRTPAAQAAANAAIEAHVEAARARLRPPAQAAAVPGDAPPTSAPAAPAVRTPTPIQQPRTTTQPPPSLVASARTRRDAIAAENGIAPSAIASTRGSNGSVVLTYVGRDGQRRVEQVQ